jgi:hypothetical protein
MFRRLWKAKDVEIETGPITKDALDWRVEHKLSE